MTSMDGPETSGPSGLRHLQSGRSARRCRLCRDLRRPRALPPRWPHPDWGSDRHRLSSCPAHRRPEDCRARSGLLASGRPVCHGRTACDRRSSAVPRTPLFTSVPSFFAMHATVRTPMITPHPGRTGPGVRKRGSPSSCLRVGFQHVRNDTLLGLDFAERNGPMHPNICDFVLRPLWNPTFHSYLQFVALPNVQQVTCAAVAETPRICCS